MLSADALIAARKEADAQIDELDKGLVLPLRLRDGLLADDQLNHMWLLIRMLSDALKPWYVNVPAAVGRT